MEKKYKDHLESPLIFLWLSQLEKYPERQTKTILGEGTPRKYKACCLGEAELCIHRIAKTKLPFVKTSSQSPNQIFSEARTLVLSDESYQKLKLNGDAGDIRDERYSSLANMNDDGGLTWPEIAKFIRENPEKVFNL